MKRASHRWMTAILVVSAGITLSADRVKLRSCKVIEGMFMGADSKSVRVLLDDGQVREVPIEEAVAVEFSARKPTPPPAPPPARPAASATAPAPKPAAKPALTVPAGTTINVRLTQGIDVDATQAGQTFKALVDDPIMIGGNIVVPRGASAVLQAVKVEQSGKMKGSDLISLKMHSFTFGGMVYEVTTNYVESKSGGEGKKTAGKIGGGAGLGALIGGIAGGGKGAAIGAAVGAAGGAAVAAGGEQHLKVAAETRLQFKLTAAVNVKS